MKDLLSGWKEIAKHLKVTERTAQRYRECRGLPVTEDPAGHPIITKEAADKWRLNQNIQ